MVTGIVLDASFAISWVVESERTAISEKYLQALRGPDFFAVVPSIWVDEISNVLLQLERSKKISRELAEAWIESFLLMPIRVGLPSLKESLHGVRLLAQAHNLTVYDARYLHLAIVSQVPLATLDKKLRLAAPKVGVKLLE